jgi:hypothetical protein
MLSDELIKAAEWTAEIVRRHEIGIATDFRPIIVARDR